MSIKPDVVLDTNFLGDFLVIFYENNVAKNGVFKEKYNIKKELCYKINLIIKAYRENGNFENGLIVASAFAFVELTRQFEVITHNSLSLEQFRAFITQPPEWFFIAEVDLDLASYFYDVPHSIDYMGRTEPIEWTDAIHVATANAREPKALLATTDHKLKEIKGLENRLIT